MSDDSKQAADEKAASPVAGERLAEARRLKQISLPDVARQLHLDEPRVQALEENRFDVLGAPVFAKGYLRKYARLVGVPIDDIMADYYTLNRATGAPPVVGPPRRQGRDIDPVPWIVGLFVALLLAGAAFWWLQRAPLDTVATEASEPLTRRQIERRDAQPPADDTDRDDTRSVTASDDAAAEEPPAERTGAGPAAALESTTADRGSTTTPAGGSIELRLAYSGDCWTEITDADGRRLFFDLGTDGRTVTVRGTPPIRVLVGNEENVRLTVDGRPYTIATANRRGNTARFTVNQ